LAAGVNVVSAVEVAPEARLLLSSLYWYDPMPPLLVHVHLGRRTLVGEDGVMLTLGGFGALVSILIAKRPAKDQFPAKSRSDTNNVCTPSVNSTAGV
jgi:hypothetical protein